MEKTKTLVEFARVTKVCTRKDTVQQNQHNPYRNSKRPPCSISDPTSAACHNMTCPSMLAAASSSKLLLRLGACCCCCNLAAHYMMHLKQSFAACALQVYFICSPWLQPLGFLVENELQCCNPKQICVTHHCMLGMQLLTTFYVCKFSIVTTVLLSAELSAYYKFTSYLLIL